MLFNNTNMRTAMAYTNAVGDKVYPIIVDIKKGIKSTEEVSFVSSDINTGVLSVAFIQGNDTYNVEGAEVICSIMRPDASTLDIPCTIVENNIVEVPLGINGTSQDGIYSFDFKVFKGGNKIVGTPIMNYSVSLSISNDLVVEEDDRLPVLTMLMTQLTELKGEARESINQANVAAVASKEATAKAIVATNNANAVSERVSQEASEVISRVDNKVNDVETRFNALTSSQQQDAEVIDARDGETSLKARLDRDIEKAKQIYADVEGSHISTDSSSGYAKDVEILGNTVQDASNLADIRSVGGKVEGQELYEIPIVSCGKNLLNKKTLKEMLHTYIQDEDGSKIKLNYVSMTSNRFEVPLSLVGNYTISYQCKETVGGKNPKLGFRYSDGSSSYDISFVTTSNYSTYNHFSNGKDVVGLCITYNNTGGDFWVDLDSIQLEEGTVATPYEPYQEDKLTILSPTPLEKVGDVADRIIEKDGVWGVEKHLLDVTFTGNEEWLGETESIKDVIRFRLKNNPYDFSNINKELVICDKFTFLSSGASSNYDVEGISVAKYNNYGILVSIRKDKLTSNDSDGFNAWLKNNGGLKVIASNNTPQFIPLPHDQQIKLRTFANKTNISFLTEIEGTIKAQVPKSLGATVNTHTTQISNLNKELDRVKKLEESTVSTVETESDFTTVEATSNGYFEDVKLEGKTLVNLGGILKNINCVKWQKLKTYNSTIGKVYTSIIKNTGEVRLDFKNNISNTLITEIQPNDIISISFVCTESEIGIVNYADGICGFEWVLLEGDHTQNPPSYFEGLKSVGQDVDEIVVSSVKGDGNLFDINEYRKKENWTGGAAAYKAFKIQLKPNTKYTFNRYDYCGIGLNIYVNISDIANSMATEDIWVCHSTASSYVNKSSEFITNETGVVYINTYLATNSNDSDLFEKVFKEFSIYEGTTSKPYTPYKSDKKRLLFYNEETQSWEKPVLREWDSIEKHANGKYYYHQRSGEEGYTKGDESVSDYITDMTTTVKPLAQEKVYECTNIDLITYADETNYIVKCGAIVPKSILKVHNNISNVVKILQEKVSILESNVKASQEVQDMMILETDMRMLDIELALMEFAPMKLNLLGGSDMLRSATYFNFLKNHIVNETYEKEYLENVMNKYLATGRINQDEYDELYKMLYPPVYDIELPIEL